jgi:hypothetical protein
MVETSASARVRAAMQAAHRERAAVFAAGLAALFGRRPPDAR